MRKFIPLIAIAGLLMLPATTHAAGGGGATSVALTGGSLTVTGGTPGTLSATLNGMNQKADTTLGAYNPDDATGSNLGWNVTFQATQFTCTVPATGVTGDAGCQTGFTTLPWNSLSIAPPSSVSCASSSTCSGTASSAITANTAVDTGSGTTAGAAVKVVSAAASNGAGSWTVTPGTIGAGQLELAIPGNALATTYHSTLTITVNSGP